MIIRVNNYEEYNTVITPLIMLSCSIEEDDNDAVPKNNIQVNIFDMSRERKATFSSKVTNKCFMLPVQLFQGENCIEFCSCEEQEIVLQEFHLALASDDDNENNLIVKPLLVISAIEGGRHSFENEVPSLLKRIDLGLSIVQAFFSERLYAMNLRPRKSFILSGASIFKSCISKEKILEMVSVEVWEALAREIMSDESIWNERHKYIAFLTHPWKDLNDTSARHLALGAGGLALLYYDLLTIWPERAHDILGTLHDSTGVPLGTCKTLTAFHSSVGRLYGASLGMLCHEVGHVFDLGHTERGLMGSDFHRFSLALLPPVPSKPRSLRTIPLPSDASKIVTKQVFLENGEITEDVAQLIPSCASLLFYNRWFQSAGSVSVSVSRAEPECNSPLQLIRNTIKSTVGLTVIEIRDMETGQILSSWDFGTSRKKPLAYTIGKRNVPFSHSNIPVALIAQDEAGQLLKTTISRDALPEGVTNIKHM